MKKASKVRERILNTAGHLFYEQGYLATGINQIIDEAEIAKSSLYEHFSCKEDLLTAYLNIAEKEWFDGLRQEEASTLSPVDRLLGLFDYRLIVAKKKMQPLKGCAFVRVAYEMPNLTIAVEQVIRKYKESVREYIFSAVTELVGANNTTKAESLTDTIYYIFEGCGVESTIFRTQESFKKAKTIVSQILNQS